MANGAQPVVKISGYLEKKAKLRIGSPWKKYWFVLEGRLLLYYRSKDEYEALSPCKGSINLCPPCNVKPALSATGVFQIECRASTVTLRAENRPEQERWMQALLAAIAQSKSSPNRMSHFRYSLDDLPIPNKENKKSESALSRQNTMPYRISSPPKANSKDIIHRLQQMGAQTYGGSLTTITKLANKDQQNKSTEPSPKLSDRQSSSSQDGTSSSADDNSQLSPVAPDKRNLKLSHSVDKIPNLYDNDQYSTIQEENSIEVFLDLQSNKTEDSERIKSVFVDNDQYVGQDIIKTEDTDDEVREKSINSKRITSVIVENDHYCRTNSKDESEEYYIRNKEMRKVEHLYERISSDSVVTEYNGEHTKSTESTKLRQNVVNLYERISSSSSNSDIQTKLSEHYSVVLKDKQPKDSLKVENSNENRLSDHEYSVPINFENENTDHNKNSLIVDNDQYIPTADDKLDSNPYSNGVMYRTEYVEYDAIDKIKEREALYEDPDRIKENHKQRQPTLYQDIEPMLPPRPDPKKQESYEETSSQSSSNDGNNKRKNSRFKKFTQFIKSEKKSDSSNDTSKAKPKKRSTSFIRRVWRRKAKSLDAEEEITYETVDYELTEKQVQKDKNDIQMLQELQKILESRKNMLQEKLNISDKIDKYKLQADEPQVKSITEEHEEESPEMRSDEVDDEQRPVLPPRQSQSLSPQHDISQNNKTAMELIDNSLLKNNINNDEINSNTVNVKTIDEILEDLDKEKNIQDSRQKVKQLIEKFNEFQGEEEVVLRKKPKFNIKLQPEIIIPTINRHNLNENIRESDELTKLLKELSKVTCAPVLTPGVTSSLVTPVLTDEEWLQLIPIRRRRLSEPDYDVPRPHRSLQLHGRTKEVSDNPIPATRFFGPILPPTTTNNNTVTTDSPSWSSMDPDSLELLPATITENQTQPTVQPTSISSNFEKDHSVNSYTSHDYIKNDEVIYAHPKAVMLSTKPSYKDQSIYSNFSLNQEKNFASLQEEIDNVEINVRTIEINESLLGLPIISKSDETFIDSLEPLAEISTAF